MKKTLFSVLLVLLAINCSAKKYNLELNLKDSQTFTQNYLNNMKMELSIKDQKMPMNVSIKNGMSFKVIDKIDTTYQFEICNTGESIKINFMGKDIAFSTDDAPVADTSNKNDIKTVLPSLMKSMMNKPYKMKMSKKGRMIEVEGLDSLFSELLSKFPAGKNDEKEMISKIFKGIGNDSFKNNMNTTCNYFPDKKVKKGDKWTIKSEAPSIFNLKQVITYELSEVNKDNYVIIGSLMMISEGAQEIDLLKVKLPISLSGTGNIKLVIDRKSGWVVKSENKSTINLDLTIPKGTDPKMTQDETFNLKIDGESIIE
jgi:hypothetical protein